MIRDLSPAEFACEIVEGDIVTIEGSTLEYVAHYEDGQLHLIPREPAEIPTGGTE